MLDDPSQAAALERQKKTRLLIIGGAASLVLPLLGAAYLYWANSKPAPGPSGRSDVFERREDGGPIVPSRTVGAGPAAPASAGPAGAKPVSSIDFIKADPDFQTQPAAARAAAPAAKSAPAAAPTAAKSAAAPHKAAAAKKAFVMPKLQPTRGFSSNFGSPAGGGAGAAPSGNGSGQDVQQMLQNLPPGAANNPDVQKYIQSQQGH